MPRRRPLATLSALVAMCCALLALPACQSSGRASGWGAGRTTVYTPEDMNEIADAARQDLSASDFLTTRTPASPRVVLQPASVRNVSSERIDRADQWAALTRVLYAPGMLDRFRAANIDVVTPEAVRDHEAGQPWAGDAPTHALNCTFASVKRAGSASLGPADDRKDVFNVDYSIVDLRTRDTVWTTTVTIARTAKGLLVD